MPVVHCVKDTIGWQIMESLITAAEKRNTIHPYFIIDKPNFGSSELVTRLQGMNTAEPIESIPWSVFVQMCALCRMPYC